MDGHGVPHMHRNADNRRTSQGVSERQGRGHPSIARVLRTTVPGTEDPVFDLAIAWSTRAASFSTDV